MDILDDLKDKVTGGDGDDEKKQEETRNDKKESQYEARLLLRGPLGGRHRHGQGS